MSLVYDREKKEINHDIHVNDKLLSFLYETRLGYYLLKIIILPIFSKIIASYYNSRISILKIKNNRSQYKSYNEYFARKKENLTINSKTDILISPADSKLLVYKISKDAKIEIKNHIYTVDELVQDNIKDSFFNGYLLVFRLGKQDYHRFCNIDGGETLSQISIKGELHTVSEHSYNYKVLVTNSRIVNLLKLHNFGEAYYIEVGALTIGRIIDYNSKCFDKGDERGYFLYGGSTIVIILNNVVKIDQDIIINSGKGIETKVKYGERIGVKCE